MKYLTLAHFQREFIINTLENIPAGSKVNIEIKHEPEDFERWKEFFNIDDEYVPARSFLGYLIERSEDLPCYVRVTVNSSEFCLDF